MRSRLRVDGLQEAVRRVDVVGDRGRRPEPALRAHQTLQDLTASERRRFDSQRGWKRLTPDWVREKRRRGLDPRILRATGRLERSLTSGAGITFKAFNGTLSWGIPRGRSDLYYAQALAKGTSSTPARRMVVIDRTAKDRIAIRVERYVAYGEVS
jgi:hypothetical protein